MGEALSLAARDTSGVLQGGVCALVVDKEVVGADKRGDDADVDVVAGREDEGGFFAGELGEAFFEALVHLEGAVEQTAAGAACAVFSCGVRSGFAHAGVGCESEVVV